MNSMKCFPHTSRKFKNKQKSSYFAKIGCRRQKIMVLNIIFALRYFCALLQSRIHCLFQVHNRCYYSHKHFLLKVLQMCQNLSLKNEIVIKFNIATSNLGHNKVSVLYRQSARHIHKYEEL